MLSTMKNKISKEVSDEYSKSNNDFTEKKEATNLLHYGSSCWQELPGVVSHIPPVSVAGTTSAESSLASLDYHPFGPLSRKSDDETCEGSPPLPRKVSESRESHESDEFESQSLCRSRTGIDVKGAKGSEQEKMRKRNMTASNIQDGKKRRLVGEVQSTGLQPIAPTPTATLLLSRQMDDDILNPLHAFVRKQIEVFTATQAEMAQPAPGRKNPVQLHQVGLRCIHCRDLPAKDRVKRAVCYPSSVGRVYHSVSDMKFDHFGACKGIPDEIRARFNALKEVGKKKREKKATTTSLGCSSSTAQYYHDSARQLGMTDNRAGVFMAKRPVVPLHRPPVDQVAHHESGLQRFQQQQQQQQQQQGRPLMPPPSIPMDAREQIEMAANYVNSAAFAQFGHHIPPLSPALMMSRDLFQRSLISQSLAPFFLSLMTNNAIDTPKPTPMFSPAVHVGAIMLASPMDQGRLNSLHCFVRRHVEIFAADKTDIAAPSPGRKHRVLLGQVGIRCVHCAILPQKQRVKRAVCYPPAVNGIYHSVSNMKFDHFGSCRGLSTEDRAEFTTLRASSGRRGVPQRASKDSSNSTAQYYHDSAIRLGLVDTDQGIRFKDSVVSKSASATPKDSSVPTSRSTGSVPVVVEQAKREVVPSGISALVIAATDPEVRAAYRSRLQKA